MFSKQTIAYIFKRLPQTYAEMTIFLIQHDLDNKINFLPSENSIPKMSAAIVKYLVSNPDAKDNFGNNISVSIISEIISKLARPYYNDFDEDSQDFPTLPGFYHYLRFDGYDIDFNTGKLIVSLPEDIKIASKEDILLDFLNNYGFSTTKGHYENARGSYIGNNLAALNSQLRTFTESLFIEMATHIKSKEISNSNISLITPVNATTSMQILKKCSKPILDETLNEWDGQGNGYIQAFWKRLHPQGSHPGLPALEESIYRFQLVVLNTHLLVERFKRLY